MKNFLLIVMLVVVTGQGYAAGKVLPMPQIATVSLSKLAPLRPNQVSISEVLAVMPVNFLHSNHIHGFYRNRTIRSAFENGLATITALSTGAYAGIVYAASDPSLFSHFAIATGGILTMFLSYNSIGKGLKLSEIMEVMSGHTHVNITREETNEIVIYEKDGEYHVGLLNFNDQDEHIVTDREGNQATIDPEQLIQLLRIRDGAPFGYALNKQKLVEVMSLSAKAYIGTTLAFTHQGKNYLSTVTDVPFAHKEGRLTIVTAEGEEMQIRRGKDFHSNPSLVKMPQDSPNFKSGAKINGVLFLRN